MLAMTSRPSATAPLSVASRPVVSDSVPPAVTAVLTCMTSVLLPDDLLAPILTEALAVTPPTTATPTLAPMLTPEDDDLLCVARLFGLVTVWFRSLER